MTENDNELKEREKINQQLFLYNNCFNYFIKQKYQIFQSSMALVYASENCSV